MSPGLFSLRASAAVSLRVRAALEREESAGTWTALADLEQGRGYRLQASCSDAGAESECLQLADRALVPVAWSGLRCAAQCGSGCAPEEPSAGKYRLVVQSCDGSRRFEGPSFTLPESSAKLARLQAASAERAELTRVNGKDVSAPAAPETAERIAGFRVQAGAPRALSPEVLTRLSEWLRSDSGFNDKVVKRCVRGVSLGLIMHRALPDGSDDRTELALDFGCNALIVVRDQGGIRRETASFFDASRASILDILRPIAPDDALAPLK